MNLSDQILQKDFASLIGISEAAVSGLLDRGVIQRGDTAAKWLLDYTEHLREVAAGRLSSGNLNLAQERARLAKEQADERAMKNAVMRREFAPIEALTMAVADAGRQIAQILEALPVKLKRRCPHLLGSDIELIQEEIVTARNVAAGITINLDEQETDGASTGGADARAENSGGTAADSPERMG